MSTLSIITLDCEVGDGPNQVPIRWPAADLVTVRGTILRDGRLDDTLPAGGDVVLQAWVPGTPETPYVEKVGTLSGGSFTVSLTEDESNPPAGVYQARILVREADDTEWGTPWYSTLTVLETPDSATASYVGAVARKWVNLQDVNWGSATDGQVPVWNAAQQRLDPSNVGAGDLISTNNLSDLANAATALANLGLGSVDNTADADKPVSTAQQTALDGKQDALTAASQVEMETGTEPALRSMSPLRVAQAIAALGGGGSGGWFSTMNASNLIGALSTSPIGYAAASLATVNEENFGAGLQSSDSTQRADSIGLEFPIPDFVTAYDDSEAVRIRYFGDSIAGTQCKFDVEVIGKTTGSSDTLLHSETVTISTIDTTEELLITAADLGATIYDALVVKITFYSKDNDAIYITSISVRGE